MYEEREERKKERNKKIIRQIFEGYLFLTNTFEAFLIAPHNNIFFFFSKADRRVFSYLIL